MEGLHNQPVVTRGLFNSLRSTYEPSISETQAACILFDNNVITGSQDNDAALRQNKSIGPVILTTEGHIE